MTPTTLAPLLAAIVHGGATPLLWIIGIILIVVGVVSGLRRCGALLWRTRITTSCT